MSYERYIKRGGKLYGPYIYESKRVGGKIVSSYIKPTKKSLSLNSYSVILAILLLGVIFSGIFYYEKTIITGKVTLQISDNLSEGDFLKGHLNFILESDKFNSSILFAKLNNQTLQIPLSGMVDFSGGESYPDVSFIFKILIVEESSSGSSPINNSNYSNEEIIIPSEQLPIEEVIISPPEEEEIIPVEIPNEVTTDPTLSSLPMTGSVIEWFAKLTGKASSDIFISESVKKGEEYTYNLNEGERIEIQEVKVGEEIVSNSILDVEIKDNVLTITTDYSVASEIVDLSLDLSKLNLVAQEGTVEFGLESGGEIIFNLSEEINLVNFSDQNFTLPLIEENLTLENITLENVSYNVTTELVSNIRLGEEVKWKKIVKLENASEITIEIPDIAENITVNKINEDSEEMTSVDENKFSITGEVISSNSRKGILVEIWERLFVVITGRVIDENVTEETKQVVINDSATEYEIEYTTPAPYALEENKVNGKQITIVGPEEVHYQNITAFADLGGNYNLEKISLVWNSNNNSKVDFDGYDVDEDGLVDYIEWVVPHLSNQTYSVIFEGGSSTSFISTWNTSAISTGSSNATTITLPLEIGGNYSFTVDWGDGNITTVLAGNSVNASHTYSSSGVYTLIIEGTIKGFRFNNAGDKLKINNVSQWGVLNFGNNGYYFYGCSNLNSNATDVPDLTGTTSFKAMFQSATNFNGNISNWDTSNITTMGDMFSSASKFNQSIGNWNTSKVVFMNSMFQSATSFNHSIGNWDTSSVTTIANMFVGVVNFSQDLSNWNTAKVTDMSNVFQSATSFNGNISNWNTSKVTSMISMFYLASSFNQSIGNWDTGKVTTMANMFFGASKFNQPIGNWNTSNVITFSAMFAYATSFNQDLINWDTHNVTTFYQTFQGATAFNQSLNNWNTSKVTVMTSMFQSATSFNQPLDNWDTSKVGEMRYMFQSATNFSQNLSNWNVSKVALMNSMFQSATSFNGDLSNWNPSSATTMISMFQSASAFNQNISNWNTSKVTDMSYMFKSATNFNGNVSNWDTSKVTTMLQMFQSAFAFNQSLNSWDVSKVTTFNSMFFLASSFNQPLNNWNPFNVADMYAVFYGASSFNQNLSNWDTHNVTSFSSMFQGATRFNGDLSTWNTSKVISFYAMFSGDTAFNQSIGNWDTSKVTDMRNMFVSVTNFNQDISTWDTSKVTLMNSMFQGATAFNQPIGSWNVSSLTAATSMFNGATAFNQPLGSWNVSSLTAAGSMFSGVTLSVANYNNLLIGWSSLPTLKNNTLFSGGNSKYCATAARAKLISNYNWAVSDGGQNATCDTTSPSLVLSNYTGYNNQSVGIQYSATDVGGISYWWINDTTNFQINQSGYLINLTELFVMNYSLNVSVNDTSGNVASGISILEILQACVQTLSNTTATEWANQTSCRINDTVLQNRSWVQYDQNSCGYVNQTFWETQEAACNYCSYNITNTTATAWANTTCASTQMNQSRSWVEYDSNATTCYAVTGIASDLFANVTYYEYQLVGPTYSNTSWSAFQNQTICQANNTVLQNQSLTQFDIYACAANTTFWNYTESACDFCSYNITNTSKSEWNNLSCIGDYLNQSRNWTEYDSNYSSCYVLTGLSSDLFENISYFEYQQLSPNLVNTSWTNWTNLSCVAGNMNQTRSLVEYDLQGCRTNLSYTEYNLLMNSCSVPVVSPSGGGGGVSLIQEKLECIKDEDCALNYSCFNNKCVKLFDVKFLRIDSPISPGEFLDFTYFTKGMATINGDVIIDFWLEKDGQIVTTARDTVYYGSFEEKTDTTNMFLPSTLSEGVYQFFIRTDYQGHKTYSQRDVEIVKSPLSNLDISLINNLNFKVGQSSEFSFIVGFNKDSPVSVILNEVIKKGNEVVWKNKREVQINRSLIITEYPEGLDAGKYRLEINAEYEDKDVSFVYPFEISKKTNYLLLLLLLSLAILLVLFAILKVLKNNSENRHTSFYESQVK